MEREIGSGIEIGSGSGRKGADQVNSKSSGFGGLSFSLQRQDHGRKISQSPFVHEEGQESEPGLTEPNGHPLTDTIRIQRLPVIPA
jgi:hypothetical protein